MSSTDLNIDDDAIDDDADGGLEYFGDPIPRPPQSMPGVALGDVNDNDPTFADNSFNFDDWMHPTLFTGGDVDPGSLDRSDVSLTSQEFGHQPSGSQGDRYTEDHNTVAQGAPIFRTRSGTLMQVDTPASSPTFNMDPAQHPSENQTFPSSVSNLTFGGRPSVRPTPLADRRSRATALAAPFRARNQIGSQPSGSQPSGSQPSGSQPLYGEPSHIPRTTAPHPVPRHTSDSSITSHTNSTQAIWDALFNQDGNEGLSYAEARIASGNTYLWDASELALQNFASFLLFARGILLSAAAAGRVTHLRITFLEQFIRELDSRGIPRDMIRMPGLQPRLRLDLAVKKMRGILQKASRTLVRDKFPLPAGCPPGYTIGKYTAEQDTIMASNFTFANGPLGRFRNTEVWNTILDLLFGGSEPLIPGPYGYDLCRGTIPTESIGLVLISILHAFEVRIARARGKKLPSFGNEYQLKLETLVTELLALVNTDPTFSTFIAEKLAEGWRKFLTDNPGYQPPR